MKKGRAPLIIALFFIFIFFIFFIFFNIFFMYCLIIMEVEHYVSGFWNLLQLFVVSGHAMMRCGHHC